MYTYMYVHCSGTSINIATCNRNNYRILGNVCVVYILRISEKTRFCDFNFCECKINY